MTDEIHFNRSTPHTVPYMFSGLQFHLQVILRKISILRQEILYTTIIIITTQQSKFQTQQMPISIMPTCPKLFMENTQLLEIVSAELKTVTIHSPELIMRSVEGQAVGGKLTNMYLLLNKFIYYKYTIRKHAM